MQQWTSDTQIDIGKSIRLILTNFSSFYTTYFVDFPVRVMLLPSLGTPVAARVSTDVGVPAIAEFPIYYYWVLAARARPCAARTRLFQLIATPNMALRASPPTAASLPIIRPPTPRAFFFQRYHRDYEI
jgi:hypothetical protein